MGYERQGVANPPGPAGSADTVDIVIVILGQ
jgi:hypothetical protein